ncbi:MAG: type VI secretion system contractile sheath large subunit [Pseudomonadota bacterium]
MAENQAVQEPQGAEATTETKEEGAFASLLQREFRPQTEQAAQRIEGAVQTLAEQALADTALVSDDAIKSIQAMIAAIDHKLTDQVNQILHHEDFKKLEGAWRGLSYLVNSTETDEMLKLRVMNLSKAELGKTLARYEGTAWDQSPIFKQVYTHEYSQFGGEPFGCMVGDYEFDNSPGDVALLRNMAQVSAAAHAPFVSAAGPTVFGMETWQELMNPRDLTKITLTPEHAAWNSLRESEDSRYLALAMPRVLARLPYGAKTDPVDGFDFEEDVAGSDHTKYTWMNAAYAMAVNINRSFKMYGWCSRIRGIESGGAVTNLPVHTFPTDDGGVDMKCPTEIAIDDRREAELAKLGLMPLVHKKNSDMAAFIGAQSMQKPQEYDDPDATANANLSARLPYIFATCRFAHYLKSIARDKVGSFKEKGDMQKWLQRWINSYVDGNPDHSTESVKAQKPLRDARVVVEEVEENQGYYTSRFYLRPHYQLEGLTASLRLVSRIDRAPA